jgi:hypothetical protein
VARSAAAAMGAARVNNVVGSIASPRVQPNHTPRHPRTQLRFADDHSRTLAPNASIHPPNHPLTISPFYLITS